MWSCVQDNKWEQSRVMDGCCGGLVLSGCVKCCPTDWGAAVCSGFRGGCTNIGASTGFGLGSAYSKSARTLQWGWLRFETPLETSFDVDFALLPLPRKGCIVGGAPPVDGISHHPVGNAMHVWLKRNTTPPRSVFSREQQRALVFWAQLRPTYLRWPEALPAISCALVMLTLGCPIHIDQWFSCKDSV